MTQTAEPYGRTWRRLRERTYQTWLKGEGVPVYAGSFVEDLHTAELGPWPRFGQQGAVVCLADQELDDGWLIEIAPGGRTEPVRHLCEATVYVVEGRGATTIWPAGSGEKRTVEWQSGSLFSPPMNCWYQHFNLDGDRPTRIFAATTAPLLMNALRSIDVIFDCDYAFHDRYGGASDYFTDPGRHLATGLWETNFVADVNAFPLDPHPERAARGSNVFFSMAGNGMSAHLSEFETGTYKKAHRHGPGAEIIILSGSGYSLLWFRGQERQKVDWRPGSLISPRDDEYHQHFNTGPISARYLAFTFNHLTVQNVAEQIGPGSASEREGGGQIEYEDEEPEIYDLFARECERNGGAVLFDRPRYITPAP